MWSALVRAAGIPIKLLFGFDAFVSYARQDGTDYAEALSIELGRFIRPRTDMQETRPGKRIPFLLRLSIMLSKVLVVVCTPQSVRSIHVKEEIQTFVEWGGGPVVLVEVSIVVEEADWWPIVHGLTRIRRENEELALDSPSARVVQRIVNNVGYWRLSRRQSFASVLFGLTLAVSLSFSYHADVLRRNSTAEAATQTAEAGRQRKEALEQAAIAESRRKEAAEFEAQSRSRALAAQAEEELPLDQPKAVDLAIKAWQASKTREASSALARVFPQLLARVGHKEYLTSAGFSPDGLKIITASGDHTAALWNANDNQLLFSLPHDAAVQAAVFSPDGQRAVTADSDGLARVWRVADGQMIATLSGNGLRINTVVFSPDGGQIVTAGRDHTARLWNGLSGELLFILGDVHEPSADINNMSIYDDVNEASFSSDGRRIVAANKDGTASVWNASTGRLLVSLPATYNAHITQPDAVRTARFSPDGRQIVTASEDETVRVWNASSGHLVTTLAGGRGTGARAILSPDGRRILTVGTDKALLWDASNGKQVATLEVRSEDVASYSPVDVAAFSRDSRRIVIPDSADNTARVWDASDGRLLAILSGHNRPIVTAAFSPDGGRIVTASSDTTAVVWGLVGTQLTATLSGHTAGLDSASFSPDGRRILTTGADLRTNGGFDHAARVWNAANGLLLATLSGQIGGAVFSPNGEFVLTIGDGHTAQMWNASDGYLKASVPYNNSSYGYVSAIFSPDGDRVVAPAKSRTARIWNTANGKLLATLSEPRGYIDRAAFSPDGRNIVTTGSGVRVWDASGYRLRFTLSGHTRVVDHAEFSPDGGRIFTASEDSGRIWQTAQGRLIASLVCSPYVIEASAFTSDGKRIITTCADGRSVVRVSGGRECEVRVWDAFTGKRLATISTGDVDRRSVSFSRDGLWIVATAANYQPRVWNTSNGALSATLYPRYGSRPEFSPYAQDIVTVNGNTARVYRLLSIDDIAELLRQ